MRGTSLVMVGIVALAGPALAAPASVKDRVESRLARAGLDQRASIEVEADPGGAVVLSGLVTSLADARQAGREAEKVADSVDNRLVIAVPERSDADIEKDVRKAILGYVHYSVFDSVGIAVRDGHVLLAGSVYRGNRKNDIEDRIAAVPGVRSLTSEVTVQPPSSFDDRLRRQLVRSIYGANEVIPIAGVNPPVRIVVERGRVTLTGSVGSRVDQFRLGVLARETLALSVDNQVRLDGDDPPEPAPGSTVI